MLVDLVLGTQKPTTSTVILVDVLRSSTTITVALNSRANSVVPCRSIREARRVATRLGPNTLLLGERHGVKPRGFHLNISPNELLATEVQGKNIVYSSTNLTRVLEPLKKERRLLVGGLVNARQVAKCAKSISPNGLTIVSCGLDDAIAVEDIIGAGAIASYFDKEQLTDSALTALSAYQNPKWMDIINRGLVSNRLRELDFEEDTRLCTALNSIPTVPILRNERFVKMP